VVSSDEVLIRELVDRQVEAMTSRDAAAVVGLRAADVVGFTLAPPLVQSGADMTNVAGTAAWFATFDGPLQYEVRDLEVTVGGDVAFCHSLNRMSAVPVGMAEAFELWFRATLGLRKVDGEWRVTHEHQSTPFYMDGSLRAAVDLKPEA
jgi:uncharacterized protein (TIGR02246 family)